MSNLEPRDINIEGLTDAEVVSLAHSILERRNLPHTIWHRGDVEEAVRDLIDADDGGLGDVAPSDFDAVVESTWAGGRGASWLGDPDDGQWEALRDAANSAARRLGIVL